MISLVVVGAGGFGRETLDVIEAVNAIRPTYDIVGVVDDAPGTVALQRLKARGIRHIGTVDDWLSSGTGDRYVIAIGAPAARHAVANRISGIAPADPLLHPASSIGSQFTCGAGSVICAHATISTNVTVGAHVHLNPAATLGHDVTLADCVSINPGAVISGEVHIDRMALVGAGAVVLQGHSIGEAATVGAAACVVRDVPPGATVKGIPAA